MPNDAARQSATTPSLTGRHRAIIVAMTICCALGVWLSGRLLINHAGDVWNDHRAAAGLLETICGSMTSLGFDCDKAAAGPWSEIQIALPVPGLDLMLHKKIVAVPVAFISLAYFIFMGAWTIFVGWPKPYSLKWHRLPKTIALLAAAASIFFIALMALGQAPWCLPCLAVHALNLILVAFTWRLNSAPRATQPIMRPVAPREAVTVVAFSLIIIAGAWKYRSEHLAFRDQYVKLSAYRGYVENLQRDPDYLTREYLNQPLHPELVADARDVPSLVVFTDFQCKSCYCNWRQITTAVSEAFDGRLNLVLKHYPLCADCNPDLESTLHPDACRAARAAAAARIQGGDDAAWRMHELLFQRQNQLDRVNYAGLAEQLGLDQQRFIQDMNGPAAEKIVAEDVALARILGVRGTPAMFLDGREVPNFCRTPVFWQTMAARAADAPDYAERTSEPSQAVKLSREVAK